MTPPGSNTRATGNTHGVNSGALTEYQRGAIARAITSIESGRRQLVLAGDALRSALPDSQEHRELASDLDATAKDLVVFAEDLRSDLSLDEPEATR